MATQLTIAMGQLNFHVGDIMGNTMKIISAARSATTHFNADILVLPELALTGYPPEDLLFRPDFHRQIEAALYKICQEVSDIDLILGFPLLEDRNLYNAAAYIQQGSIIATYRKAELPNYGVFDEKRYFTPGHDPLVIQKNDMAIGIAICEDLWLPNVAKRAQKAGAELLISINASPFDMRKMDQRQAILTQRTQETQLPIIYVHSIGGQDELVFDGSSLAMERDGEIMVQAPQFKESITPVILHKNNQITIQPGEKAQDTCIEESIYRALMLSVKDYIHKNGFEGAIVGLSGGIDSALTFAIAADALDSSHVEAVLLPSRHTADMSVEDATTMAETLKAEYKTISIEPTYEAFIQSLSDEFKGLEMDKTEENLQARCRGVILMAISNKKGRIVLTTGNKSEMAVGYSTLYGDMAGSFAVLKDVPKVWVYRLANFRNSISPIIPQRIIDREPSAELAPDQVDQDTLPPYSKLDNMLQLYVEQDKSIQEIVAAGYDREVIEKVIKMVDRSEYKRRQAPPGPRITDRAFGRERRYPITSGFKPDIGAS